MNIKQLGRYFSLLHRYKRILITKEFEKYGIGAGQYMFLVRISENEGLSQKELTEKIRMDKATTTKAVKKMEDAGLIKTCCACHDKRQHELYTTDKGKALLPKLEQIIQEFYGLLCEGLTEEDLEQLSRILSQMENNLCNAVEDIKKEKCCHES